MVEGAANDGGELQKIPDLVAHTVHPSLDQRTNSGPAPTEHLLAALGACVASTYASHAALRGVGIEELTVDLEAELDLRGLFQLAPVRPGISGIKAKVRVRSDVDEEVLEELARLTALTSPIHDSLSNPVPIESSVERGGLEPAENLRYLSHEERRS